MFCCSQAAQAQDSTPTPTVKQTEQYCMVMATARPFTTKVTVTLDYGQATKLFGMNDNVVKDEAGKITAFNSVVDALNYMNSQGWEFVNAYAITIAGQNVYHFLMRRRLA
jgi:tryptophan synthase beta subunit